MPPGFEGVQGSRVFRGFFDFLSTVCLCAEPASVSGFGEGFLGFEGLGLGVTVHGLELFWVFAPNPNPKPSTPNPKL